MSGLCSTHSPVEVVGIGRRHSVPHHRVQKRLALPRVETQDLRKREEEEEEGGVACLFQAPPPGRLRLQSPRGNALQLAAADAVCG